MAGFELVPLEDSDRANSGWELTPVEPEKPSVLKTVALENPLTAIAETGANLASQAVALPLAGLAGLATEAAHAVGLTDKRGADVVRGVLEDRTYQPRGEMGKAATQAVMYPFEKLAEVGTKAGTKTLEATGSPAAATVVDTAINALPMAVVPAWKAGKSAAARGLLEHHPDPSPQVLQRLLRMPEDQAVATYEAWRAGKAGEGNGTVTPTVPSRVSRVEPDAPAMPESAELGLEALRREGNQGLPAVGELPELHRGYGEAAGAETLVGAARRERGLRADELQVAGAEVSGRQSAELSQAGTGWPDAEHLRGRAPAGQEPVHIQGARPALSDESGQGSGISDPAGRASVHDRLRRQDAEHQGMGEGVGDTFRHLAETNRDLPASARSGTEARQAQTPQADSIARAERILTEQGTIAGWVDHYNRYVRDGQTVESFRKLGDGRHEFRITDGRATRTVVATPEQLSNTLATLRDPAKVREIEARNVGDVVLGKPVRALSDAELAQWSRMEGVLAPQAIRKLQREIKRRESDKLKTDIDAKAHEAATSPLNKKPEPTAAQIEAGTYAKGHLNLHGLDISIENPKGSTRRGTDANGRPWETRLENHYGYFKRSQARDGDHVDVFIGDKPESPKAFIIDQIDPKTGKYDEPKVILGATDAAEASRIYHANYEPGWKGMGAISEMPVEQFREWVKSSEARKPVALPKIAGRFVTEFDDAGLQRVIDGKTSSEQAKAKAQAEIERRTAGAEFSAESPEVMNSWAPGANYVPLVDQHRPAVSKAASVTDLPAPKRREAIIKEFASAIGTTVYEGRIKGEKRLGYFRPKIEEVRTKHANDIEVAGHEIAHLIDFRVPELAKAWHADKELRTELKSVSYDQKNVREGWAEGVRLWLTQPETLEAKAPKVHAFIEDFANRHPYGKPLRKAQEQMTGWFGQDALNRARSKIGTEMPLREYMDRFWDKFRQSTVDDLHGIYQMERSMLGEIRANGPYESARLSRASASIADGAVRFGYPVKNPDGSFKFAGKGLEEILQPVSKNIDDALLYFVGRSAHELMMQGREHLFTRGEIDAMLKLKTPERAKAFAEYQEWNQGILDFAEAQGIINPEARRLWQRTQYLPFHRVDQPGGIKGKPGDWAGIQALTGGTTNIKDVLGNMIGNAAMLIDKAVKNEARRKVAKLSQMEGGGRFMVKIEPGEKPVKIGGDQVIEAILKKFGIAIDGDAPAFFEFLVKGQPPAGNNVVAILQSGKPIWFEVGDPILYRALKAIDRPIMNEVVKWLGLPKRIGQATITATPDFWMANIARDTIMGSVMSRAGFRPILDSLKGMATRMTSDPAYKDYLANGGGLSSIFLDEHHLRSKLERYYREQGIDYRTVLDTPDKILTFVETLGDAFEMSTRLGEYKRAIAMGENPRHAAYLGRDVSTDFAMRGDSKALGFMYDTVMFLKPAVVSWDRLFRGLAHDQNKGAIAAKAGMLALASAGLYLLNRDDPRYQDLPDWDRDANWHFFIGDQHYRWPKIWEIGALSSAAERSTEKILDEDPEGLGKDFARILGATFNLNLMPQILAPLYEQGANRNSFTKSPIETPGMENVQPFLRAKPGTSETMKALGLATRDNPEWAQINPVRAEALLRGYFNTYALYGLMLTDAALFDKALPEKRTDELPVVRRFYSQEPPKHTKYEAEFYDLLAEAKRLRGTMRELDERGMTGYADAKEQSPLAGEAKPLERAAKNLGTINNEMEAVRRDGNLTPRQKRERLDALTVERNALLKAAVQDSEAARKESEK